MNQIRVDISHHVPDTTKYRINLPWLADRDVHIQKVQL
jgi:hypothetical protein